MNAVTQTPEETLAIAAARQGAASAKAANAQMQALDWDAVTAPKNWQGSAARAAGGEISDLWCQLRSIAEQLAGAQGAAEHHREAVEQEVRERTAGRMVVPGATPW